MDSIDKLTELFEKFPGIGPRQARRFVQYLLATAPATRSTLADLIKRLGVETLQCKKCHRWFAKNDNQTTASGGASPKAVGGLCSICSNSHRNTAMLFVVEKEAEIDNVERSGYQGLYFVLGGTVPLAAEEPDKHIRGRLLLKRVEEDASAKKLQEVILGLSATTEGDHTRHILEEKLRPLSVGLGFTLSALGRGLSTGSELEYADPDTIASALSSRQ